MKRIILIIASILFLVTGAQAQNANRKGFFIELQAGTAMGEVLKYDNYHYNYNYIDGAYLKGGIVAGLDLGYRFRTSNSFAFEAKAGVWSNLSEPSMTTSIDVLPGLRWTSKEFGSSNMSMFIAINTGIGMELTDEEFGFCIPLELGIGVNFTNSFYGGLFISGRILTDSYRVSDMGVYYIENNSYGAVGLRLGYRF